VATNAWKSNKKDSNKSKWQRREHKEKIEKKTGKGKTKINQKEINLNKV